MKKLEPRRKEDRQRQADMITDRRINRQTDRQTDRLIDTQTGRQNKR